MIALLIVVVLLGIIHPLVILVIFVFVCRPVAHVVPSCGT
jgi:hypothetical protein